MGKNVNGSNTTENKEAGYKANEQALLKVINGYATENLQLRMELAQMEQLLAQQTVQSQGLEERDQEGK